MSRLCRLVTHFRLSWRLAPPIGPVLATSRLVTHSHLRSAIRQCLRGFSKIRRLVTHPHLSSPSAASTPDAPCATAAHVRHGPAPGSSPGSPLSSTTAADAPPCSPGGIRPWSSSVDGEDSAGLVCITPGNAGICGGDAVSWISTYSCADFPKSTPSNAKKIHKNTTAEEDGKKMLPMKLSEEDATRRRTFSNRHNHRIIRTVAASGPYLDTPRIRPILPPWLLVRSSPFPGCCRVAPASAPAPGLAVAGYRDSSAESI